MIDPNHLYTLHHTYTGKGCAMCGKDETEHQRESWMVDGKQVNPSEVTKVEQRIKPKTLIEELMDEAGITKESYEYGQQYNLTHASLSDFGIRCGLDQRIKDVMEKRGLGKMTEKGRLDLIQLFEHCRAMLR